MIVTDLCLLQPDPESKELIVVSLHEGVTREQVLEATEWPIRFADDVEITPPPSGGELAALRNLYARTARAHGEGVGRDASG